MGVIDTRLDHGLGRCFGSVPVTCTVQARAWAQHLCAAPSFVSHLHWCQQGETTLLLLLPALFPPPTGILLLRVQAAAPCWCTHSFAFSGFSPVKAALSERGNQNHNVFWKPENKSLCHRACSWLCPAPFSAPWAAELKWGAFWCHYNLCVSLKRSITYSHELYGMCF